MLRPGTDNIGRMLAIMRKKKGITQEEAAKQLGISRTTLSKYENQKAMIPMDVFIAMSDLYDFDPMPTMDVNDPTMSDVTDEELDALADAHERYMTRQKERLSMELMPEGMWILDRSISGGTEQSEH